MTNYPKTWNNHHHLVPHDFVGQELQQGSVGWFLHPTGHQTWSRGDAFHFSWACLEDPRQLHSQVRCIGGVVGPQRYPGLNPWDLWIIPCMAKALCRCDLVKNLNMGRLSRVNQVGSTCHQKCPDARDGDLTTEEEGPMTTEASHSIAGFITGGRGPRIKEWPRCGSRSWERQGNRFSSGASGGSETLLTPGLWPCETDFRLLTPKL